MCILQICCLCFALCLYCNQLPICTTETRLGQLASRREQANHNEVIHFFCSIISITAFSIPRLATFSCTFRFRYLRLLIFFLNGGPTARNCASCLGSVWMRISKSPSKPKCAFFFEHTVMNTMIFLTSLLVFGLDHSFSLLLELSRAVLVGFFPL